ncbi:MAG TPA: acyltransferase [Acidimicrobiales bacterium]|nr:acyltransferase [Acidimicrobiales bacterium]
MNAAEGAGRGKVDRDVVINYPDARTGSGAVSIGPDPHLRSGTVIYAGSIIGARLETGHNVVIREGNLIGDDVSIWSNTLIDYGCRIGHRVKIHCNCYVAQYTELDDDVFLAPGVCVANDLYPGDAESARRMRGPKLGAGVQIGVNVTILPFVEIGAGALVGAGSVVTRDLPAGSVAYGNPARPHGLRADLRDISARIGSHGGFESLPVASGWMARGGPA